MTRAQLNRGLSLSSKISAGKLDLTAEEACEIAEYFESMAKELREIATALGKKDKRVKTKLDTRVVQWLEGQKTQSRIYIADLAEALDASARELEPILLKLQDSDQIVLYREDNTRAITPRMHEYAIEAAGNPRHIIYRT